MIIFQRVLTRLLLFYVIGLLDAYLLILYETKTIKYLQIIPYTPTLHLYRYLIHESDLLHFYYTNRRNTR